MEGLVSVLDRGQALQFYLASYVVPVVDVGFQISLESFKCLPVPTSEEFIFQMAENLLCCRIVPAITLSGHALNNAILGQYRSVGLMLVLPAHIRV